MKENLEALAIEERKKYFKEWRANNKKKVSEYNKRYWVRKASKSMDKEDEDGK